MEPRNDALLSINMTVLYTELDAVCDQQTITNVNSTASEQVRGRRQVLSTTSRPMSLAGLYFDDALYHACTVVQALI